ncbi:unnamed protein product [Caenorhabditis sp. 36 PRJEB53466]|nr:unnamed protein product [Caenorhabditis sp. 36 PRJEB53466]
MLTIAGNCLVVIAVCTKKYLRNPTGFLIISLAIADLIVGVIVMPMNSLFEMANHSWLFGLPMCDVFHAMDILASTSSIWNLCVISLDRYMAGKDPIGYRDKVSKRRILMAIFCVWVLSAILSFPAIIWWRTSSPHLYEDHSQCLFTDSKMYRKTIEFEFANRSFTCSRINTIVVEAGFITAVALSSEIMDSREVVLLNSTSPRQSSDTEMSSSCATSTASAIDEADVRYTFHDTIQAIRTLTVSDDSSNRNGLPTKTNGTNYTQNSSWVRLNVGGKVFQTTKSTLMREPGSFLYRLCQEEQGLPSDKDETGAYLIDRDPNFFSPILNYLRHGKLIMDPGVSEEGILVEADFYNLPTLSQMIMDRMQDRENELKTFQNNKFVYRVLQCHEEELASVVSAMTDGWKIVQVVPINSNYSAYTAEQPQEYLCIVERECPDNGNMLEGQDRAKLLQQRARHN